MGSIKQVRRKKSDKTSKKRAISKKLGKGIINNLINKLPFEAHLPGYQYCGPGTKIKKRLARGDLGINALDQACKLHDIAYENKEINERHKADKQLEYAAWDRVKARNSSIGEKAAAWFVTNVMKVKRKLGMGHRSCKSKRKNRRIKRKTSFGGGIVSKVKSDMKKFRGVHMSPKEIKKAAETALKAARKYVMAAGGKGRIVTPRIIPIPKTGGILPLIPIFAGLSALGSLAGAATGIAKAVDAAKVEREQLSETNRHNQEMEAIARGKSGQGLYLRPYRKGLGLYLKPYRSKN